MILLDTPVVLWLTTDPGKLSVKATSAITDARMNADGLAISDITLLELTTLTSKGRLHLDISLESLSTGNRVTLRCSPNHRPRMRTRHQPAAGLSQ